MSSLAQRFPSDGPIGELLTRREAPPLIFLVLLFVGASLTTTGFLTFSNIEGVVEQIAVIAIVAVALNQVILAGRSTFRSARCWQSVLMRLAPSVLRRTRSFWHSLPLLRSVAWSAS